MKTTYTLQEVIALTSAIVHADEAFDCPIPKHAEVDRNVFKVCINSPVVREIMREMEVNGFLPLRRDGVDYK